MAKTTPHSPLRPLRQHMWPIPRTYIHERSGMYYEKCFDAITPPSAHRIVLYNETLYQIVLQLIMPKCLETNSRSLNQPRLLRHTQLDFHLYSCESLLRLSSHGVFKIFTPPQGIVEKNFFIEFILSSQRERCLPCESPGMSHSWLWVYK